MPVGTDIVKISRMQAMADKGFPSKVFTNEERRYIDKSCDPLQTAAGIYAAKEAVAKAIGRGISLPLNEINIAHLPNGAPYAVLGERVLKAAMETGSKEFEISISHDGEYAVAYANSVHNPMLASYKLATDKLALAPEDAILPQAIHSIMPERKPDSHKGNNGRIYILAGSVGLTGAAVMASKAALKTGAGLITLGCARELNPIFEVALTEVMTKPLESKDGLITAADTAGICKEVINSDMALIGPGLGRSDDITEIVRQVLNLEDCPCVADADALYALSRDMTILKNHKSPLILTPHIGEFAYLTGLAPDTILSDTRRYAIDFAQKYNVVLVLKSHNTVVAFPDGSFKVNYLGNPGMATGGTGDVLSGVITALAHLTSNIKDAATAGVYLHSLAADMAAYELGEASLTPSDILNYLPYAIKYTETKQ